MVVPQTPQYDLLIRNGRIVDGSGRAAYVADVAIKGDRIAKIGKLSQATATKILDAQGLVVAPGSSTCWASLKLTC
jgi:N-acyl-D-aspartate/D-glutamate deacylase